MYEFWQASLLLILLYEHLYESVLVQDGDNGQAIHDAGCSSADGTRKGPQIELVHGHVAEVRADSIRAQALAEVFLLVDDLVFSDGHHTYSLDSLNSLSNGDTGENRVW